MLACLFGLGSLASALGRLTPEPVPQFDGKEWSGITLGVTTDGDIKKDFGSDKSPIRPEALQVRTVEGTQVIVTALLNGRGTKALVTAIRLDYPGLSGPLMAVVTNSMGITPFERFAETRYEDWSVFAFEERGVVCFALNNGANTRVQMIVLMQPDRVPDLLRTLDKEPSEVEEYDPRIEDRDLRVDYGTVSVNLTGSSVDFRSKREYENDIRDDLERRGRSRYLDFYSQSNNVMSSTVTVRWDSRRETLTYSANLSVSGRNVLGNVSASGSASRTITRVRERPGINSSRDIRRVVEEARDDLERNFDTAVRRQRPPTKEEIRFAEWNRLVNEATTAL